MPTNKEELLLMLEEGLLHFLNPRLLFRVGLPYQEQALYKATRRLEKDNLIRKKRRERKVIISLTKKGKQFLEYHRKRAGEARQYWDHKWRVVIFDIPEKRTGLRNSFREFLETLDFGMVQKSVWISPYDFENQVDKFARKLNISNHIYQLTVAGARGYKSHDLVRQFWDIPGLHLQYRRFIREYSEKIKVLHNRHGPHHPDNLFAQRRLKNNLLWDYQSILARDPRLPLDLLPSDWGGTAAKAFIERCGATLFAEIAQFQG